MVHPRTHIRDHESGVVFACMGGMHGRVRKAVIFNDSDMISARLG